MTFLEWYEEFKDFVEERAESLEEDGDPDEYRRGYRAGYRDALLYIETWLEEEVEIEP